MIRIEKHAHMHSGTLQREQQRQGARACLRHARNVSKQCTLNALDPFCPHRASSAANRDSARETYSSHSAESLTHTSVRPSTKKPLRGCSRTCNPPLYARSSLQWCARAHMSEPWPWDCSLLSPSFGYLFQVSWSKGHFKKDNLIFEGEDVRATVCVCVCVHAII